METLYTVEQVAEKFGVHVNYVRRLARDGELPGRKLGNQWRFTDNDLQEFLNSAKVNHSTNTLPQ